MTPREKAKELVNKFYQRVADGSAPKDNAKQCALIAVDEMLIVAMKYHNKMTWEQRKSIEQGVQYYMQVKQEIQSL
jgi:hypothetical protein